MKMLVIGANGYLGARLFFDLKNDFEVIGTYHQHSLFSDFIQLNVTNKHQVLQVVADYQPDVIIQTANFASSRLAVGNEKVFQELNLESTAHIVEAANENGAKVIFISSFAALSPSDIYGQLKLKSEEMVSKTKAGYLILRPSLILGYSPNTTNDRPFNRILKCLDEQSSAEFDTSWKFQPTYIGHISEIISSAIKDGIFNKTVHVFCPSVQSQYTTAKDILEPFGVEVKPIDKKMAIPLQERENSELTALGFPTCGYEAMIKQIHDEIKNRHTFQLY